MIKELLMLLHRNLFRIISAVLINLCFMLLFSSCKGSPTDSSNVNSDKMIVYTNHRNVLNIVDLYNFSITETIDINVPGQPEIVTENICLSTDKEHLIFNGFTFDSQFKHYLLCYDLREKKYESIFPTGFDGGITAPEIISADRENEPGLIYFYSANIGAKSYDFIERKFKDTYQGVATGPVNKFLYSSPENKYSIIRKSVEGDHGGYGMLEFYNSQLGLKTPAFILNDNDKDNLYFVDLEVSPDGKRTYCTVFDSGAVSNKIKFYYVGHYDMQTKEFHKYPFNLTWCINPYYLAYNPVRNELYTIKGYNRFCVIDPDKQELIYVIEIEGKKQGPSRIALRKDGKVAFVSCADSDFIAVIDLEKREVISKINIQHPYHLLIP